MKEITKLIKTMVYGLQRAMNRLYAKECSDSELFFKIVQQKNVLEPNASTAYYLGILKDKEGKSNDAITYYKQAVELETDAYEKAKILYRVAENLKQKEVLELLEIIIEKHYLQILQWVNVILKLQRCMQKR